MRSAFCRGIEILAAAEPDFSQSKRKPVEAPGNSTSGNIESIGGIPKDVTKLKPIIDELMRKVRIIVIQRDSANVT